MIDMEQELYGQVEKMVVPIIESNAKKFHRQLGMTFDEGRQEARFGLMLALRKYDYNDSRGGIYNYASIAVRRHFLKAWATHRTKSRYPHVVVVENGKRKAFLLGFFDASQREMNDGETGPNDFMDALPGPLDAPEDPLMMKEGEATARRLQDALQAALNERDRAVLECKIDPPRGLRMLMCEDCATEPTIPLICRHLGLSKNAVDWALRRIRATAIDLIDNDFSEMRNLTVVQGYAERR